MLECMAWHQLSAGLPLLNPFGLYVFLMSASNQLRGNKDEMSLPEQSIYRVPETPEYEDNPTSSGILNFGDVPPRLKRPEPPARTRASCKASCPDECHLPHTL